VSDEPSPSDAPNLFVARQPILDRSGRLYGYELLFRSSFENVFNATDPVSRMSSTPPIRTGPQKKPSERASSASGLTPW